MYTLPAQKYAFVISFIFRCQPQAAMNLRLGPQKKLWIFLCYHRVGADTLYYHLCITLLKYLLKQTFNS